MANILEAQDALLDGMMTARAFFEEWQKQWTSPLEQMKQAQAQDDLVRLWDDTPPAIKEQARQMNPDAFARAESKVNALRK